MAMKRFLANEWDRSRTLKRGADLQFISLHATSYAEDRAPELAAVAEESPDAAYDRVWAVNVLDNAMSSLRGEYEASGRLAEYEAMKPHLTAERGEIPYEELAVALGISAVSARSSVHRFRKRFREIFRAEIANTVADPAGIEDEMRAVVAALAREGS
jgi:DNA-directed RNA polymerase specialized sigma24 family protein